MGKMELYYGYREEEEGDLIRLFCSAAFSSRIISPETGSGAHTLSVTEHLKH